MDAFLKDVKDGVEWRPIFLAPVLQSIPFPDDRKHLLSIIAALTGPKTAVFSVSGSTKRIAGQLNSAYAHGSFSGLGYEPNTTMSSTILKMQKHCDLKEFGAL